MTHSNDTPMLELVVIGAGLAGLSAARDVLRAGCGSLAVLEARNQVGGRAVHYAPCCGPRPPADGQWIGPGQTAIADLARELCVATHMTVGESPMPRSSTCNVALLRWELERMARLVPSAAPWKALHAAEYDALSLGDWLASRNVAPAEQAAWTDDTVFAGGAGPYALSLLHWLAMLNAAGCDYCMFELAGSGAQQLRIAGGVQMLAIKMARELGSRVRLSTPVQRIENWRDGPAVIHTPDGALRARNVIVALAPPACHQIAFDPPLPERRQQLQRRWPSYQGGLRGNGWVAPLPPGFLTSYGDSIRAPLGRLIWSGAETAEAWAGCVDGAVRSGRHAARQALRAGSGAWSTPAPVTTPAENEPERLQEAA